MGTLAKDVRYLELATQKGFDRLFISCLDFPDPAS
jgi:hypothetical protein